MSDWQGRKVVVPGGAGNIGSHLVEGLVADGAEVRVVDDLSSGRLAFLDAVRDRIEFVQGDITDSSFARETFEGRDAVLNMAADAPGVGHSHQHHVEVAGRNALIGAAVLEAARQASVPRVLIVSSSCVYPDDAPVPTPEMPLCTDEPERVNHGYGWGKRFQELLALHYAERFDMDIAIGRPFNAYGPRDLAKGERSHVIPALIERLLSDEPALTVWGDGTQTRSFIHCRDVAAGLAILAARHAICDPVNVGHDHETTMAELAELLMEVSGVRKPIVYDTTRPVGCLRKAADMTRFREVTGGFQPTIDIRTGLAEMVEAHRSLPLTV